MITEAINPEKMYTSEEITDYLRVSLRTTQRLLKSGLLPSFKIHGQYRIKGIDALNYLSGVRVDINESLYASENNDKPLDLIKLLEINPVEINLSVSFAIDLDKNKEDFLKQIHELREKITLDMGFICPGIRISDNTSLQETEYAVLINGSVIYKNSSKDLKSILSEVEKLVKKYAHEIISREEVYTIIEKLRKYYPIIVEDVLADDSNENSNKINIGELTKILKSLLKEKVSIRNMRIILESIADNINVAKNIDEIVNRVRQSLSRQMCELLSHHGIIEVVGLSVEFEKYITDNIKSGTNENKYLNISAEKAKEFHGRIADLLKNNQTVNII